MFPFLLFSHFHELGFLYTLGAPHFGKCGALFACGKLQNANAVKGSPLRTDEIGRKRAEERMKNDKMTDAKAKR